MAQSEQNNSKSKPSNNGTGKTPPAPSDLDHTKTISDYLLIIRERWLIALVLALAVSCYHGYKKFQTVPLYKTQALVLFEIDTDRVVNISKVVEDGIGRAPDLTLRNHLTHLRSISFLNRVVESLSEDEVELVIKDYRDPDGGGTPSVHGIIAGSNHIIRGSGQNFHFEFHHRNPEAASMLANRFVDEYVKFLLEKHRKGNDAAIRFLRAQSEELKLKVEVGELEVQNYRKEHNLISLEESENIILERMKTISGALNQAKLELLNTETSIKILDDAIAAGKPLDSTFLAEFPEIQDVQTELKSLLATRERLAIKYLERWPEVIRNEKAIEVAERVFKESINEAITSLRNTHELNKKQVETLTINLEKAEKASFDLAQKSIDYNVLRDKVESDRALHAQIQKRRNETMIASQLVDTNLRIVDRAPTPGVPFLPDNRKIISTSVLFFMIIFIAVPFALSFINSKLKSRLDIEHYIGKEFLGEVHKIKKRKGLNVDKIVLENSDPRTCEFFRMLYSHVLLLNPEHHTKTFVVTSMSPQEGKSFMASNLAATFNKHELKTILIDCDLRQPSLHKGFDLSNEEGILTWNADDASEFDLAIDKLGIVKMDKNFDLIRAGGSTRGATEVLSSDKFKRLIKHFQSTYDIVMIDTPPSAVFSDALLMGQLADYYIFVCKQKAHERRKVKSVIKRLDQSRAKVMGLIFNQTNPKHFGKYGGYYDQYSYYGEYYYGNTEEVIGEQKVDDIGKEDEKVEEPKKSKKPEKQAEEVEA